MGVRKAVGDVDLVSYFYSLSELDQAVGPGTCTEVSFGNPRSRGSPIAESSSLGYSRSGAWYVLSAPAAS